MTINREAIFSALFGLASAAPGLVTTSRKLLHWSEVPASHRPALFQAQGDQDIVRTTRMPTKYMLSAKLYVYVSTGGAGSPGEVLNPILDYIDGVLADPFPGQPQTLGGLVEYARIDGRISTSEGTLGDDEVAVIPISILTA